MPFTSKEKQRQYQREYQRKRRKKAKKQAFEREIDEDSRISPEIKIAILVTVLFASSALGFLAFFDLAGPLGIYIKSAFSISFGWGSILFPVILLVLGLLFLRGVRYQPNRWQILGVVILFLAILGILQHVPGFEDQARAITEGKGGGYVGFILSKPFTTMAGYWGAWVFLLGMFVVGALLTFSLYLFGSSDEEEEDEEGVGEDTEEEGEATGGFLARVFERFRVWKYSRQYNTEEDEEGVDEDTEEEGEDEAVEETEEDEAEEIEDVVVEPKKPRIRRNIKIPFDLLEAGKDKPSATDIDVTKEKIQKTFSTFNIQVEMGEVSVGPTITQYTLKPADGVKLSRITGLANDLSLALAAHPLRIEAPIPGKSLVGIEIPNKATATVKLKDILVSSAFKSRGSNLSIGLGKDVTGKSWVVDLAKMPHLLIAGSTGSGKSVAINALITSLLYQNSPDDLKLVLVDPKKVELTTYNDIPYLLTPVITDAKKTVNALKWVVGEMERRYQLLANRGKRNILSYNEANKAEPLPYIVFIIDELADLMAVAAHEVEAAIVRLAQMARAVGIHLVLATQRPSVNVLTGLIKANVPSRIAFAVPSQIDSRTILDMAGAEKLLGRGDMLFVSPDLGKPRRLQGAYLKDEEIERVVNFLKDTGEVEYSDEVTESQRGSVHGGSGDGGGVDEDDLYDDAKDAVVQAGKASASLLQRRLRIGYARAARLLDILESEGIIGPADGAKPREILIAGQDVDDQSGDAEIEPPDMEDANTIPDGFDRR